MSLSNSSSTRDLLKIEKICDRFEDDRQRGTVDIRHLEVLLYALHDKKQHPEGRRDAGEFQLHENENAEPDRVETDGVDHRHEDRNCHQHDRSGARLFHGNPAGAGGYR